jgi:putative ABC transport system ATP-binding protein
VSNYPNLFPLRQLKDINLKIYAGEIVVIMGPSGSGKTTLLNMLSGMDRPNAGSILLRGYDITKMQDEMIQKVLQDEIGIVFQFFNLIPSLTAMGNIELPMVISNKNAKQRKTRVEDLIKEIGLEDRANHRPFTLSGGEKQRVAIAMAFANNPSIILADEPTGNIDTASSEKVMEIFHRFIKNNPDKSVIIVTHNPALRKIADRTLIIKDGRIIKELGRIDEAFVSEATTDEEIEIKKITEISTNPDQVEKILNPAFRIPKFSEISQCQKCKSKSIKKAIDKEEGTYKILNGQVLGRASVYCDVCKNITFHSIVVCDLGIELDH